MNAPARKREPRTWDPDSRIGEGTNSQGKRLKRDVWFFVGILIFAILLFFVWQQRQGLSLADELARLEARQSSLETAVLESWAQAARLKQPDRLLVPEFAADLKRWDLAQHSFVFAQPGDVSAQSASRGEAWLTGIGLDVPKALAAGRH